MKNILTTTKSVSIFVCAVVFYLLIIVITAHFIIKFW